MWALQLSESKRVCELARPIQGVAHAPGSGAHSLSRWQTGVPNSLLEQTKRILELNEAFCIARRFCSSIEISGYNRFFIKSIIICTVYLFIRTVIIFPLG